MPAQSRNGCPSAFSRSTASCRPVTSTPANDRGSENRCGGPSFEASSICASSHSPSSRAGFWPSQSRAGESDESYRYVFGGFFFLNCACVPTSGRRSASSACSYAADAFLPLIDASSDSFLRDAFASYCHLSGGGKKESVDFGVRLTRLRARAEQSSRRFVRTKVGIGDESLGAPGECVGQTRQIISHARSSASARS